MQKALRQQFRRHFRQRRQAITELVREEAHHLIYVALNELLQAKQPQLICSYLGYDSEVELTPWLSGLANKIGLPRVADSTMTFHAWQPGDPLYPNGWGILEPAPTAEIIRANQIDLLMMPLTAFDDRGTRLGMGGGYYDRYLASLAPMPYRLGVAFDVQHSTELLPTQAWDIALDAVATESGVIEFAAS